MASLFDIIVTNKTIKAAVTDDCVILTIIEWSPGGLDVKEHDSYVEALAYLNSEGQSGKWTRMYILNAEEVRANGKAKAGG